MYVKQNFINSLFDFCLSIDLSASKSVMVRDFHNFLSRHYRIDLTGLYLYKEDSIDLFPYIKGHNYNDITLNNDILNNLRNDEGKIIFETVNQDYNLFPDLEDENKLNYLMLIPLKEGNDCLGVLFFYFKDHFKLNKFLERTFKVIGKYVTLILGKNIIYEKMEQRLAELLTLQTVSDFVNSTLDFEKLIDISLDAIVGLIGLRSCSITVFTEKLFEDIFSREQKALIASVEMTKEIDVSLNKGVYGYLSKNRLPLSGVATVEDEITKLMPAPLEKDVEFKYIILPVTLGDELYGSINIFDPTINHLQNIQNNFLESFANQFSIALQNAKLYRKQSELANKDGLTNLYNHAFFQNKLSILLDTKYNYPISLILMDIDDFKKVNDYYGHLTGDKVLKELSTILKHVTREGDLVARYGGEEFVVLLPQTEKEAALKLAERLRQEIADHEIELEDKENLSITVSMGVAEYEEGYEKKHFVDKVDKLLYKAKDNGKNRVES
ncbi:MAG: diguanylate cyclase [Halothermotrichaceae bacterium]